MTMLQGVLVFIIFLGPLVFFHELGHFLFARLFGVRVEVFSIGFGPKILKFTRKGTQYAVSLIPLGGYVKMFGDDPYKEEELSEEEQKVAFNHKSKFARFWIVFGGPLANMILAFFIYFAVVMVGERVPGIRLGVVGSSSIAYDQGFRSGDLVKKINGQKVLSFDEIDVGDSKVTSITVERNGVEKTFATSYEFQEFIDQFVALTRSHLRQPFLTNEKGEVFYITQDKSKDISLEEVSLLNQAQIYALSSLEKVELTKPLEVIEYQNSEEFYNQLKNLGYYSYDLKIASIVMSSPADKAKLLKNDIIIAANGESLSGFEELRLIIQKTNKGESLTFGVLREGETLKFNIVPNTNEVNGKEVKTIGVYSSVQMVPPLMIETEPMGLFAGIGSAFKRTWQGIERTLSGYKKLILNEVGLKNIGGPLAIGKVASDSFDIGLSMFFRLMAIMSINLGLINLFPIPVLDGGHILFLGFELINRGPLSKKKMEMAQRFGMSFLFLLIFVALFNDLTRFF